MPRKRDPDYVLEADRGATARPMTAAAAMLSPAEAADREATREGARDLDRAVEGMPGLDRAARDRERAMPRPAAADIPHPRMERRLPGEGQVRTSLSSRQRKARSVTKRGMQDDLPLNEYQAVSNLVTDPSYRAQLNNALSATAGDAQELPDDVRARVQRVDRAIQAYEAQSNRGHVVYVNLEMPEALRGGHPLGMAQAHFPVGSVISLDRFTGAAHTMHEVEPPAGAAAAGPVLEVQTRRGMYLGRSDSLDDTAHLLPRGLQGQVVGMHEADYRRPDGTTGRRPVIQLRDVTSS